MVIAILGILSGVVVFAVRGAGDKGEAAAVATDERVIRTAEEAHCAQHGSYADADTLVQKKFLSAPPEIHEIAVGDDRNTFPEGNCSGSPKYYTITCPLPDCGIPSLPTTSTTIFPNPLGLFVAGPNALARSGTGGVLTPLGGGRVLHVSIDDGTQRQMKAAIYTPPSSAGSGEGSWSQVPDPPAAPPTSVSADHAFTLNNGKVLVGFTDPVQWWLYDPASQGWAPTGGSSYAQRNLGSAAALIQGDGRVLWVGGQINNPPTPEVINSVVRKGAELYDPATGVFTATGSMAVERVLHSAVSLQNGRVLVAGGLGGAGTTYEVFNAATGTWSAPRTAPVDVTLTGYTSANPLTLLADGRVLALDGANGTSAVYTPSNDTWTSPIPCGCSGWTATLLGSGKVLASGGESGGWKLFDPTSGTWENGQPAKGPREKHGAIRLSNGNVLLVGGWGGAALGELRSTEIYKPGPAA